MLAELGDRLRNAATNQFGGRLELDVLEAADSKSNDLLQVADVFVASLNRVLNPPEPPPQVPGAKENLLPTLLSGREYNSPRRAMINAKT